MGNKIPDITLRMMVTDAAKQYTPLDVVQIRIGQPEQDGGIRVHLDEPNHDIYDGIYRSVTGDMAVNWPVYPLIKNMDRNRVELEGWAHEAATHALDAVRTGKMTQDSEVAHMVGAEFMDRLVQALPDKDAFHNEEMFHEFEGKHYQLNREITEIMDKKHGGKMELFLDLSFDGEQDSGKMHHVPGQEHAVRSIPVKYYNYSQVR